MSFALKFRQFRTKQNKMYQFGYFCQKKKKDIEVLNIFVEILVMIIRLRTIRNRILFIYFTSAIMIISTVHAQLFLGSLCIN